MIKCIIFDWGGVLANSDKVVASERLAEEYNIEKRALLQAMKEDESDYSKGEPDDQYFIGIGTQFNIPSAKIREAMNNVPPGVVHALARQLSKSYKVVILSNQLRGKAQYIRSHFDISFFKKAFFSAETGNTKPDEKAFRDVLKFAKVKPEECLLIDDARENVETAKKLGMKTIHFKGYEQLIVSLRNLGIGNL